MTRLHLHEWGPAGAPPVVCLHGLSAHGRRFRKLAEERLVATFRVLAPDLRGHGRSTWEPPWDVATHVEDVFETVGDEPALWVGHSFGARVVLELAAREPARVRAAVLLDPALQILPHAALDLAEAERSDVSFGDAEAAIAARYDSGRVLRAPRELLAEEAAEHLEPGSDGRLRYRYCRSAAVAGFGELAREPSLDGLRAPTLLVLAEQSWLVLDEHVEALRGAVGEQLEVVGVPGGHSVLWDAFDETAAAVEEFLLRHASVTPA